MSTAPVKETMTSRERTIAALTGQPYDRIPVNLLISDHGARVIGVTVGEYNNSASLMAQGQVAAWRRYGADNVNTGPGLTGIAEAIGSKLAYPDSTPYVADYVVKEEADLDRLKVPDPERDGRLPLFLEAATIVLKEVGDQVPLNMTTSGPFTTATSIRGTENFLRDLHKNPQFAHRLLRLSSDSIIRFAAAAIKVGARIGLADPTASGTMISPRQFREFAQPYLQEVVTAIAAIAGAAPSLHICGNTSKIWPEMTATGVSVLSWMTPSIWSRQRRWWGTRLLCWATSARPLSCTWASRTMCGKMHGSAWQRLGQPQGLYTWPGLWTSHRHAAGKYPCPGGRGEGIWSLAP